MGLFRKVSSLSTIGLVDFRSDKERTAANTKRSAREARKQTDELRRQTGILAAEAKRAAQTLSSPATSASPQRSPGPAVPTGAPPAQWNGTVWQAWNAGANRWMIWDGQAWR